MHAPIIIWGSYFHVSPAAVAAYYFDILAVMDHDVTAQILVEGDMMPTSQGELLTRQAGQVLDKLLNRLVSLSLDLCHSLPPIKNPMTLQPQGYCFNYG